MHHLKEERKLKPASLRRKLNTLASFFRFSCQRKWISVNPMDYILRAPTPRTRKTTAWSLESVQLLLQNLKQKAEKKHTFFAFTRYALVFVLFGSGLRAAELCALRRKDLVWTNGNLILHVVKGKGHKERLVPVQASVAQILVDLLNHPQHPFPEAQGEFPTTQTQLQPVFFSRLNDSFSTRSVYNIVLKSAKDAQVGGHLTPHACRATLATLWHEQGVPVGKIQEILGHKSLSTTSVYIHNSPHQLKGVASKCGF